MLFLSRLRTLFLHLRTSLLSHGLWPLTAKRRRVELAADEERLRSLWRTTRWYL